MNIKQAKQEITNALKAYLAKDSLGNYLIPSIRQRPILLMGAPGIGKTQIMEQIAAESGVGLVAYTITHHTRQSAIGLPFINTRVFNGQEFSVTEYTMSEILSSVYNLMERTGIKEGILFLDEINCVSETLAPMMLQFLQRKTFGNQSLPEGWLIVTAGNPPEYNKSVRDFDMVTLDRIRRIDVEADFNVWKEYANKKGLHNAVVSYLDIRREYFYCVENTVDGLQFATARGWEDLSELITVFERLDLRVNREVIEQYIQMPHIARDFANYMELYYKYQRSYRIDEILQGEWQQVTVSELKAASFDEKIAVMGLLFAGLSESARETFQQDAVTTAVHSALLELKEKLQNFEDIDSVLAWLIEERQEQLKRDKEAGHLEKERRDLKQKELRILEDYRNYLREENPVNTEGAIEIIRGWFEMEVDARARLGEKTGKQFDCAFRFLEEALGQGQEIVLFVTEITAGFVTSWFVETFGCDAYFRHNRELLLDDKQERLREEIAAAMQGDKKEH